MSLIDKVRLIKEIQRHYPFMWGGAATLRRRQERRLRALLAHAAANSPFYAKRLAGLDLARCRVSDLPVLTKAEMMERFDDIVTDRAIRKDQLQAFMDEPANLGKLYLGRYGVSHTSGSQGRPALIVQDEQALLVTFAARFARATPIPRWRLSHVHRLWKPARMAVITVKPGFYPSSSAFTYRPRALDGLFQVLHVSITDPLPETISKIEAFRPEFLTGYVSALEVLAREEDAGRMNLRKAGTLRQLTNIAEPLSEPVAQYLERVFGVHIFNEYAMGECMAASAGCTMTHGSHLNSDLAILEVVDEHNRPVPPGQPGNKVLLTNLYNLVQPIIRYEIDDRVTISSEPCVCGRCLPKIEAVEGRMKDQMWIETGGRVRELPYYPFIHAANYLVSIAEHQVVQTGANEIVLKVVAVPGQTVPLDRLRQLVLEQLEAEGFDGAVKLSVEAVNEIPRGPSGKISRVKNLYRAMAAA